IRPNPFDPAIDGVENHAAAMENIISGRMMRRPETIFATELAIVLGLGFLFMPLMIWGSAAISGIGVLAFMVGYFYVDQYLWFNRGVWTYMAIPYVQILGMFVGTTLYRYMTEEKEKKKV